MIETILAIVGGCAGLVGLGISIRAERRAGRAEKQGVLTRDRELWTEAINSTQALVAMNVIYQDVSPLMLRARVAATELVDGLSLQNGPIDEWLGAEHRRLSLLVERAIRDLQSKPPTLENHEAAHKELLLCAANLVSNLRFMRKANLSDIQPSEIADLTKNAQSHANRLAQSLGKRPEDA